MGVKAGVDPVDLGAAVRQGATGRVRTFDRLGDKFLPGKHDPADLALRLTQGCRARCRPRAHRRRARGPQALANLCDRFGAATAFPVPDIRDTPDRSWYRRQCRGQPRLI
jgi:hypothetical protein